MTNLGSILKSRDITLPIKVRLVKAMVFPVVVYGCESWTVKKENTQGIILPLLDGKKTKIMASGATTSWQIDGETMETVRDFRVLGSKISADDGCSYEIKIHLLLGRKAMTNLDNILKSTDIIFLTKVCLIKAKVFPVVMWI